MSFKARPAQHTSCSREVPEKIEDRLIVALDVPSVAEAHKLVDTLDGVVSFFKVGLWLLFAAGIDGLIAELRERNKKVFVDAKMFDIGETVKRGVARVAERGADFVTVHGHADIIRAAAEGKRGSDLKVLVVPVLTDLDDKGLLELGYRSSVTELIVAGARMAVACDCGGIIAAPRDNPNEIRRAVGSEGLLVVTPAVRLPGASLDDHKRAGTPAEAIAAGADYLVVGRPIIRSNDPAAAAAAIIENMQSAT
jgi:orotidine-5'-phosphate decarboxylase